MVEYRRRPSKKSNVLWLSLLSMSLICTGFILISWGCFGTYRHCIPHQFLDGKMLDSSVTDRRQGIHSAEWRVPLLFGHQEQQRNDRFDTSMESTGGGISFRRSIQTYNPVSLLNVHFDGAHDGKRHCHTSDQFGDNACHFDWNDKLIANYSVFIDETLTEEAYIYGVFEIAARIPWSFRCSLCGEDCVWKVPFVDFNYTWSLPPCPLSPHNISDTIQFHLWRALPDNGWMVLPFKGFVRVYSRPMKLLANLTVLLTVK